MMNSDKKRLKDPIYGYVDIPTIYMNKIIDQACFQRLRRIIQTSYAPLYSSAMHNRFVHSIGVYYLGSLSVTYLNKELKNKKTKVYSEKWGEIFSLACLLHDVGHAPFSHTGEKFYLNDNSEHTDLHDLLIRVVGGETFRIDVPKDNSTAAAPHEIMSAIIGIKEYGEFFNDIDEREFFARCITGYKFSNKTRESTLKNCFISLLNWRIVKSSATLRVKRLQ